jgi:hypothetical protein
LFHPLKRLCIIHQFLRHFDFRGTTTRNQVPEEKKKQRVSIPLSLSWW